MSIVDDPVTDEKSFVITTGKYAGYTVEISKNDSPQDIWYEERGPQVLRVHYRVYRIPRSRKFLLKHFSAASAEDRVNAEATLQGIPAFFAGCEVRGKASKWRHPEEGYYYWTFCAGTMLDDPMMQLEFEMMIDLAEGVTL